MFGAQSEVRKTNDVPIERSCAQGVLAEALAISRQGKRPRVSVQDGACRIFSDYCFSVPILKFGPVHRSQKEGANCRGLVEILFQVTQLFGLCRYQRRGAPRCYRQAVADLHHPGWLQGHRHRKRCRPDRVHGNLRHQHREDQFDVADIVGRRTPPRRLGSRRDRLDAQYSKLTTMQTAAKYLIDQLSAATAVNGDVYVSIVPFAKDVNAGASNYAQSWVRWEL